MAEKFSGDFVELSDVLVENFRPGAMNGSGFGYHAVKARCRR